jgi:hypothetical protein
MRGKDVAKAISLAERNTFEGVFLYDINIALVRVFPVLRELAKLAKGWKFWLGWGMNKLLDALEEYLESKGYEV